MSIENPNIIKRIESIEERLDKLENRLSHIEKLLKRSPGSPDRPSPSPSPGRPPEPFKF